MNLSFVNAQHKHVKTSTNEAKTTKLPRAKDEDLMICNTTRNNTLTIGKTCVATRLSRSQSQTFDDVWKNVH